MSIVRFLLPLLGLTFLLALSAPAAYAHDREEDSCEEMAQKLGFNDSQKAQADDIHYHALSARIVIQARKEAAELDLHHAMMATTVDEKAVAKALDALNTAEADLRRNRVDEMLAIRKLLTPEQSAKMSTMWREEGEEDEEDDKDHGDKDHDEDHGEKEEHHGGHHGHDD